MCKKNRAINRVSQRMDGFTDMLGRRIRDMGFKLLSLQANPTMHCGDTGKQNC